MTMRRSFAARLLGAFAVGSLVVVASCELVTDFDRSKIPSEVGPTLDGGDGGHADGTVDVNTTDSPPDQTTANEAGQDVANDTTTTNDSPSGTDASDATVNDASDAGNDVRE